MAKKQRSNFIDIPGLVRLYMSKWYLFIISVLVCGLIGFAYTRIHQPVYVVKANLLVAQENNSNPVEKQMNAMASLFGSEGYVEDEIFVVKSHSLYRDVVRDLGLNIQYSVRKSFMKWVMAYPTHPIDVSAPQSMLDTLSTAIVFKIKVNDEGYADVTAKIRKEKVLDVEDIKLPGTVDTPLGTFTIAKTSTYPEGEDLKAQVVVMGYDGAAEQLDEDVMAEIASKKSNVISLGINTTNIEYGKDLLNQIIAQYNKRGIKEKGTQGQLTEKFLNDRLELVLRDLTATEKDIEKYKEGKQLTDIGAQVKYQFEKKAELESSLIGGKAYLEVLKMTRDFLAQPENAYSLIPMTINNEVIMEEIKGYNGAIMRRNELKESATDQNDALLKINERIDVTRANLIGTLKRMIANQEVSVAANEREINATDGSLTGLPSTEREYRTLARQQSLLNNLYMYLLQRREENSIFMANATAKGQIVDDAYTLSEPLGLKNKMIYALSVLFGLILVPLYLYVRKVINNRFESREELEQHTDVPILGVMSIDHSGQKLVVRPDSTSSAAELFRLMRTNLLFMLNDRNDKVVLMTSSTSGEGKSFMAINLAASLALLQKKVLLVGMDIRKPRLAQYLGLHPRYGLTQYLSSDEIPVKELAVPCPDAAGMDVIVAGPVPPNPSELLVSHKVDELFEELRRHYDYIIIDSAPLGLVSDSFTLDRVADATVYVSRTNYTTYNFIDMLNDIYEQKRLKKLSVVVNGVVSRKSYGYGNDKDKA